MYMWVYYCIIINPLISLLNLVTMSHYWMMLSCMYVMILFCLAYKWLLNLKCFILNNSFPLKQSHSQWWCWWLPHGQLSFTMETVQETLGSPPTAIFWRNSRQLSAVLMSSSLILMQSSCCSCISFLGTMYWQTQCILRALLSMVQ